MRPMRPYPLIATLTGISLTPRARDDSRLQISDANSTASTRGARSLRSGAPLDRAADARLLLGRTLARGGDELHRLVQLARRAGRRRVAPARIETAPVLEQAG